MTGSLWSDPIIATDHRLLHVSRIDTGKTVMLPARVPIGRKLPTLIRCKIYRLDTGKTVAIGKYDDLTIIYQAERGDAS